jgi:RHS repeat-associated protein
LLATDQQRSVLHALDATQPHPLAYTPYGHRPAQNGLLSLLGFNGERPAPVTGHYLLGNGYRAFNPVLMRFNSPDSLSPFGEGGLNAYAYCIGDPINRNDPTGHFFRSLFKGFANRFLGRIPRHAQTTPNTAPPAQVFKPAPAAKSHTAPIKSSVSDNLSSTSETAYELGSVSDHLVPASETGYVFHSLSDVTVYTIETFKAEAARAFRIRAETNAVNERIRRGSLTEFPPSPAEPPTEWSPINVQEWVNTTRTTRSSRHTRIN